MSSNRSGGVNIQDMKSLVATAPGFEDIQFLTNPGESALDVMNLQAMTLANLEGQTGELTWQLPKGVPL
jgi:hypothetical protein